MCGILYLHDPARQLSGRDMATLTFLGLTAQQHRGQHGGGYAYSDGSNVWTGKFFGPMLGQFDDQGAQEKESRPFKGELLTLERRSPFRVVGHLRYATAGPDTDLRHFQPQYIETLGGRVAYAANGDIPLLGAEKERLMRNGVEFYTENDAELTLRKICYIKETKGVSWVEAIHTFMQETKGAYSGILMTKDRTFFIRDELGFRPFLVGKIDDQIIVAASESCVLDILDAKFEFEVERGSVVEIDNEGLITRHPFPGQLPAHCAHCIFCWAYFAGPHSKVFGDPRRDFEQVPHKSSYAHAFGRETAREHPVKADCIAPVPQSGNSAAKGYSAESRIPHVEVLTRNWGVPRTFILSFGDREIKIRLKFGFLIDAILEYPSICIVDDSIVRANTSRHLITWLRRLGAKEVHFRIAYPPVTHPCFFGIAMPTREELAASSRSVDEVRRYIGADSLAYLSPEGLEKAMQRRGSDIADYCTACYTGKYPIPV
ncbi:MAG: amidophosphoribosyltransferase [Parcubacteria group bacterium]